MLIVRALNKRYAGKVLFTELDWQLGTGGRVGLVGANGAGKTTLLRVLAGEEHADSGQVTLGQGARLAYLPQEAPRAEAKSVRARAESGAEALQALGKKLAELTERLGAASAEEATELAEAYDEVHHAFESGGGYTLPGRAQAVLEGLGFAPEALDRGVGQLSGGWWMRVELARLLVAAPEYLLLDEPTNHLDAPAVAWLEQFLRGYAGSWLVVSHDRTFLNRCAQQICELDGGTLVSYTGNYDAFVVAKELRAEQARAEAAAYRRKAAHLTGFIDRFGAKASKARQAQSRAKQLEKLTPPPPEAKRKKAMALRLAAPERSGQVVARLSGAVVRLGERVILGPVDWSIERGQKVVVVGPNGAGKSTLLKAVAGAVPLAAGERAFGHNVSPYYFAQHQLEMLRPGATVLEEAQAALPLAPIGQVRALLGAFLFDDDAVSRPVEALSGGEKARLALAKMLAQPANFLLLDEPTNHLDLPSREALEAALEAYAGTVLVVSHDRYFAHRIATLVLEVPGDGALVPYNGDFAAYEADLARAALRPAANLTSAAPSGAGPKGRASQADGPKTPAAGENPPAAGAGGSKLTYEAQKDVRRAEAKQRRAIAEVEKDIAAAEAKLRALDAALCDPDVFADGPQAQTLLAERGQLADVHLPGLLARWERLH